MPRRRRVDKRRSRSFEYAELWALEYGSRASMVAAFGSIEAARGAWEDWRTQPDAQSREQPPEAWWQFEPGVPADLRSLPVLEQFGVLYTLDRLAAAELRVARIEWLLEESDAGAGLVADLEHHRGRLMSIAATSGAGEQ